MGLKRTRPLTIAIEPGAVLRPYTVLGADVVVKTEAELERCVVHDHVYVGPGVRARGAVCIRPMQTDSSACAL